MWPTDAVNFVHLKMSEERIEPIHHDDSRSLSSSSLLSSSSFSFSSVLSFRFLVRDPVYYTTTSQHSLKRLGRA